MIEDKIVVKEAELRTIVLPLLVGKVFHATDFNGYKGIMSLGVIESNKEGKRQSTYPQSENSYGRKRGFVCLFDLRDRKDEDVEWTLKKYYFLRIRYYEDMVFYFILKDSKYCEIISAETAKSQTGGSEVFIPESECWYPGDLKIDFIEKILCVTIKA